MSSEIDSITDLIHELKKIRVGYGDIGLKIDGPPGDDIYVDTERFFGETYAVVGLTHDSKNSQPEKSSNYGGRIPDDWEWVNKDSVDRDYDEPFDPMRHIPCGFVVDMSVAHLHKDVCDEDN